MIEAKELRLGNFVWAFKVYWTIEPADFRNFDADNGSLPYDAVHLTPEILQAAGFKHEVWASFSEMLNKLTGTSHGYVKDNIYCFLNDYHFPGSFGRRNTRSWKEGNDIWNFTEYAKVNYLHQLQNLYYSLTGEELNINLV